MPSFQDQKIRLLEEIHEQLDQKGSSLVPIVRKAARLAHLCGDEEYRCLFDLHLHGVDPNNSTQGSPISEWADKNRLPKWDIGKAFFHDRKGPDGKVFGGSLEALETILDEFKKQKQLVESANNYEALTLIMNAETPFSQTLIRIRNRVGNFVRDIEVSLTLPPPVPPPIESNVNVNTDEITKLKNFLQENLRKAIFNKPEKESEVQDTIEALLIGRGLIKGIDYDRETGRVKVSAKEVIPDFVFPKAHLALEVKFSKDKDKSKQIIDEINADIRAYSKTYSFLIFVVYDLGAIRDEVEFKQDLTSDSVAVIIVKH